MSAPPDSATKTKPRSVTRIVVFCVLVASIAVFGWRLLLSGPPAIAPPDISSLDPDLAELIAEGISIVDAHRRNQEVRVQLGKIYEANGLHALAASTYQQVLDANPRDGQVWFRYAICLEREGDLDAAIDAMESCIALEPDYPAARWRQAIWLVDVGRNQEAAARIEEGLARAPADEYALAARVKLLVAQHQNAEAVDLIDSRQLEDGPNRNYVRFLKANAFRQLGKPEEAMRILSELGDSKPVWRDPWSRELQKYQTGLAARRAVASQLVKQGRVQEAVAPLKEIVQRDPADYRSWNLLGYALLALNQGDESIRAFRKAAEANPTHFGSKKNLAHAMLAHPTSPETHLSEAIAQMQQAVQLRPQNAEAKMILGGVHLKFGQLTEARDLFEAAAVLDDNPEYAIYAGFLDIRLGDWERAIDRYTALEHAADNTANWLLGKAAITWYQGDHNRAEQVVQQAVAVGDPDAAMLKYVRELIKRDVDAAHVP